MTMTCNLGAILGFGSSTSYNSPNIVLVGFANLQLSFSSHFISAVSKKLDYI